MSEASDRPQDRGRPHRRTRTAPATETAEILDRYRVAMRVELAMILELLEARKVGLLPDAPGELVVATSDRGKLWDLAIKLGRELAAGEDLEPDAPAPAGAPPGSRQAPRLSAAARRSLGG